MRRQYNTMHGQFMNIGRSRAEYLLDLQWQRAKFLDNYQFTMIQTGAYTI